MSDGHEKKNACVRDFQYVRLWGRICRLLSEGSAKRKTKGIFGESLQNTEFAMRKCIGRSVAWCWIVHGGPYLWCWAGILDCAFVLCVFPSGRVEICIRCRKGVGSKRSRRVLEPRARGLGLRA